MVGKKNIVCPVCKRRFSTKAALDQHSADAHKASQKQKRPARKQQPNASKGGLRKSVSFGSDFIGVVNLVKSATVGKRVFMVAVSPSALEETRLSLESKLWARWRPLSLRATINCGGSAMTFGQVIFGWTPDATPQVAESSAVNVISLATYKPHQIVRLNATATLNIPCETSRKWYQTNGDLDQTAQGSIVACIVSTLGGFEGYVSISLTLDWRVEFEGPSIAILEGPVIDTEITPDSGWSNLFTTSDGSFDAERLTFKMHHGGDMAPWSSARHGVVYGPSGKTVIPYVREDGTAGKCFYLAKISNYSIPGMLLFSSYEKARAYITTGDLTNAIKYTSQGDEVTPAIPLLKAVTQNNRVSEPLDSSRRIASLENAVRDLTAQMRPPRSEVVDQATSRHVKELVEANKRLEMRIAAMTKRLLELGTDESPLVLEKGTIVDPMVVLAYAGSTSSGVSEDFEKVE